MYVRKERLDLRRYCKQGESGLPQPKFKGSEMSFPAFSAGHFQEINTKENAIISCLIYISGVKLSAVKVQCSQEKKKKDSEATMKVTSKGRDICPSDVGIDTNIIQRFINHPDRKRFQGLKIYLFLISPVRTGECAYMDATPLNL